MQLKLEDILRKKERELKLYQRFLDLKQFFEKTIFPSTNLPLKQHIEELKSFIENIVPDPKDRTEEMFSGEVFILICSIYLHDVGLVNNNGWHPKKNVLDSLDGAGKRMFLNYGICEKLGIPEPATDIINYLIFSRELGEIPTEWEITEDNRKAIVRNTRVIAHVFNFAHLMVDMFRSDLKQKKFRRFNESPFVLRHNDLKLRIDSREGLIYITYKAKCPYELHLIEHARRYTETIFNAFKRNINGKFGFNYKEIVWDITYDFSFEIDVFNAPRISPYNAFEGPPLERWGKASLILDKLFNFGYAIAVGATGAGKTTIMRSFIVPQILSISPNVFYCEIWEKPVNEMKNIMCKRRGYYSEAGLDIISLCSKFAKSSPSCFFILDSFERYAYIDETEKEKLDRFIKYCIEEDSVYLIISGDKDSYFEWYKPLSSMDMSSICEIKTLDDGEKADISNNYGILRNNILQFGRSVPISAQTSSHIENLLETALEHVMNDDAFRNVIAIFADKSAKHLKRYSIEDIFMETGVPHKRIIGYLGLLKDKDIIIEYETTEQVYYALSNRMLKEPLYRIMRLQVFEEKRKIRTMLQNLVANESYLDVETLHLLERWKGHMIFSKEEMGLILSSIILHGKHYEPFFEKAKRDEKGIDIQPILKLLYMKDPDIRMKAINLLVEIQDKDMVNPFLEHLKKENVLEIKDLMIRGMGLAGKKRTIIAIMDTLKGLDNRDPKLQAIEFFYSLLNGNFKSILVEFREVEKDPVILTRINDLLLAIKES